MTIKRRIAALVLTTGLAAGTVALSATLANAADALPWYGCKAVDLVGAGVGVDALVVGGGTCQGFAGAPEFGPIVTESIIMAPSRDVPGKYSAYACKGGFAGALGDRAVKGAACGKLEMSAEALRAIVGEADFDKAFGG